MNAPMHLSPPALAKMAPYVTGETSGFYTGRELKIPRG